MFSRPFLSRCTYSGALALALTLASPAAGQLVLDELNFNPGDGGAEFVEVVNIGVAPVVPAGWCFGGVTFCFPATVVSPGEVVVLAADAGAFTSAYGFAPDFVFGGGLSNGGETISLKDETAAVVDSVAYLDRAPWPTTPDGEGPSLERIDCTAAGSTPRNWRASTEVEGHSAFVQNCVPGVGLPPFVTGTAHGAVAESAPIAVTATVVDATSVTLVHVLDFGSESPVAMLDDGASGDGSAGDGVYGAEIPGQAAGTLVRYRIEATGPTGTGNDPRVDDTIVWRGTMIEDATASDLPIFHWWIHPDDYQDLLDHYLTDETEPGLLYYDGRLWDNVQVRVRGSTSRQFPKKSWKFNFPQNNDWEAAGLDEGPNDDFNLKASYSDKSFLRELLAWEAFEAAGVPGVRASPVRLHQNGAFYGLYHFVEQPDGEWLERVGLDPDGALYEAEDYFEDRSLEELPDFYEKESREEEDFSDLAELVAGVNGLEGTELRDFLFDRLDLPEMVNYLAVTALLHNNDHVAKNYFLHRDSDGTGRWRMLPWDLDLTFGRNWIGTESNPILNDQILADNDDVGIPFRSPSHPLFGDCDHLKWEGYCNMLIDALHDQPEIRAMYFRRLRTVMDTQLVEPLLEDRIAELVTMTAPEAALDVLGPWGQWGEPQTGAEAAAIITDDYLPRRRTHLFATHRVAAEIPAAQVAPAAGEVAVHEIGYAPVGGDDHEYVELHNRTDRALDLSGWTLDGVTGALPPGTVLIPRGYLVLALDDVEFRAEHGGGRFLPLDYGGSLADAGEALVLRDAGAVEIDRVEYLAVDPWPSEPAGGGPSLSKRCQNLPGDDPASWEPSEADGGTPGLPNGACIALDGFEAGDFSRWSFSLS